MQRVPFHGIWQPLTAVTQELLNLNPSNMSAAGFTRLAGVADNFVSYRIRSMKFRIHPLGNTAAPGVGTVTAPAACCFTGGVQDTSPSTIAQAMEILPSAYQSPQSTHATPWVKVPAADLAGPMPWYKSLLGTADASEESPGLLVLIKVGIATVWAPVEIMGVYEFRAAVAPANTPAALQLQLQLSSMRREAAVRRERLALLRVLAPPAKGGATTE